MARRRGRRRRGAPLVHIPVRIALPLGTLGDGTVITSSPMTFGEDFYWISATGSWSIRDLTAGEGPIAVGINHGDLTVAEIAEALDADLSDPDDIIAKERSRRPVRKTGQFSGIGEAEVLNNGIKVTTPARFSVGDTHTPDFWARNLSGGSLTTGAVVAFDGILTGRWQR